MVEISQADVMGLKNPTVERLSNLTGVPGAQIMACGPQYAGDHLLTYKGETFGTKFMTRNHTTYCPACLLDDRTEELNGERIGRLRRWLAALYGGEVRCSGLFPLAGGGERSSLTASILLLNQLLLFA